MKVLSAGLQDDDAPLRINIHGKNGARVDPQALSRVEGQDYAAMGSERLVSDVFDVFKVSRHSLAPKTSQTSRPS